MPRTKTSVLEFDDGIPAEPGDELVFCFSGFRLNIDFDNDDDYYNEDDIISSLQDCAKEIWIDKTYVNFSGTKYKNVFLKEDGWNILRTYVWQIFNKRNKKCHEILRTAFESMIVSYMEHIASLMGLDPNTIDFYVDPDSKIDLRLYKDTAKEWLTYPGPWQDWPENN